MKKYDVKELTFISDLVLLALISLVLLFGIISVLRVPKENSSVENRTLTNFELFKIQNFMIGQFQDDFEDALSDQFVCGETIKKVMN